MNTEYTHTELSPYESKDVSKWLWIVMSIILVTGYILEGYSDKPETREIHHLNEYRGYIINMQPVTVNEHCFNQSQ